jgi:hypothetical protein
MCFYDLSSCNLIGLASSISIAIGENLTANEASLLSALFSAIGDNLNIIAVKKSTEESNS